MRKQDRKLLKKLKEMGIDLQVEEPTRYQKFLLRMEIPYLKLKHRMLWLLYNIGVPFRWLKEYFWPAETNADVVLEGMLIGNRADRRARAKKLGFEWPYYMELEFQMAVEINKKAKEEGYKFDPKLLEFLPKPEEEPDERDGGEVPGSDK